MFGARDYNNKEWSGCGVAFGKQYYLHKDSGKNANNLIILGADLSDSNDGETKKNILISGKGSVQINNTTIQAKSELKANCTLPKKFILSVHYNGMIAICLLIIFSNINSNKKIVFRWFVK